MAPSWRLLAKFGEVELPGPLLKTDVCPCGFCWCGKFSVERSPMSIFRTFISTKARETLKELLDGDGLSGDFGGCVSASTSNGNANQDLSGHHASTSEIRHLSAASEETRKKLDSSAQREESLQASELDSEAASTRKTIEEDEESCSSFKSRSRSSETNSQTSLPEGENSNSSSSTSDLNSQLSTSSASDDQSSSSLLSELSGHETLNFTRQNNTIDSISSFCFRRKKKAMTSTMLYVPNTRTAAKSECDHCEKASIRSSAADSNSSTSESAESPSGNRWSQKSEKTVEFQGDSQTNSLAAQEDKSSIDHEPLQNSRSNTSIESEMGKNRVSAGDQPSINHIKMTTPAELEHSQIYDDQVESLPMDISFGDQNQVDQGVSVAEISEFSSASSEVPKQEASSGSSTPVVNSGGCQTTDESIGRTSDATKPDLSKEIPKFRLGHVNREIVNEADEPENRDHFDGTEVDSTSIKTSPAVVCVNCSALLSKTQPELENSTSSNGNYQEVSGSLMCCPTCATCQMDLPNRVAEASEDPVSLIDHSQDADNDELCDEDVDANPEPITTPKYKRRKSSRLLRKNSSEVVDESSKSSDEDGNAEDSPYNESGNESGDSAETTDDGEDSDDDDNAVAASSHDLSDIQEQNESDAEEQTDSNPRGSRQQNVRKKAPNAKPTRRKFCCLECGDGFRGTKALNQHLREHDSVQPFKCGLCTARFETRKKYLIHHKSHKDQTGRFNCNQCKYSTQKSSNIINHLRIHSGEKLYTCDNCGKKFKQHSHLTIHKRIHSSERPYKCDVCKKSFKHNQDLEKHMRVHSGERPYECDVCKKTFKYSNVLKGHKRIHSGERPYKCDDCSKSFKRAHHLKDHKQIHSGERPYQCDVCNKTFKQSNALNSHKQIHSCETPYQCPKCAKRFTTNSNLQKHQKRMHRKKKSNQHSSNQ